MRRGYLLAAFVLLVPLAAFGLRPAAAVGADQGSGARGNITMRIHTHSSEFGSPSGSPTLVETHPLPFPPTETSFSYASIPCDQPAPFNDRALNFSPDYPGIEDPAPVRHIIEGRASEVSGDGDRGTVEGAITTFLCEDGEEGDQILTEFEGRFKVVSENEAKVRGNFEIVGGTGRFEDLSGRGGLQGRFTCLEPILERHNAENCADLGAFSEAIFIIRGTYADPTTP